MEKIVVHGGVPLMGSVEVSGSKNAALPIIYACALVPGKVVLEILEPPQVVNVGKGALHVAGSQYGQGRFLISLGQSRRQAAYQQGNRQQCAQ